MSETPIARRVLERMRRQARSKVVDLAAFSEGNEFAEALQNSVVTPAMTASSDHVVFTSPYVLIAPDVMGWTQYFDRIAAKDPHRPRVEALERHLKWGTSRRYWPEFVFESYVNHQAGAIFLKGLPDDPESRPHSKEYVRHANGH